MNTLSSKSIIKPLVVTSTRMELLTNKFVFEPLGLTSSTIKILHVLDVSGFMTPTQIMAELGGTKSNITQRLNLLEKNNLIRRISNDNVDKRKISIEITSLGKEKIAKVKKHFKEKLFNLEKFFSDDGINFFFSILKKVNKILDECEKDFNKKEIA